MRQTNWIICAIAVLISSCLVGPAFALIMGSEGNNPVRDMGWPEGSLELANQKNRVAMWEGPPFGGGQTHFEFSGSNEQLQTAVDLFANIKSKRKRILVIVESRNSVWARAKSIDWEFVVWIPDSWKRLKDSAKGRMRLLPPGEEGELPLTAMNVYLTDRIDWKSIKLPAGIEVQDHRLEAQGFAPEDGGAMKGQVLDHLGKPIANAKLSFGSEAALASATTDAKGEFTMKRIPEVAHKPLVARADGFASLNAGQLSFKKTTYREVTAVLAPATKVKVKVVGSKQQPLPNAEIRIASCTTTDGKLYEIARPDKFECNENGEATLDDIPHGELRFSSRVRGYYLNSVTNTYKTDQETIELKLQATGSVTIFVADAKGEPITSKYMVEIEPEEGGGVGTWGGSANVNKEGTVEFDGIPPGRYVIWGRPNPGREQDKTDRMLVDIKEESQDAIKLIAK